VSQPTAENDAPGSGGGAPALVPEARYICAWAGENHVAFDIKEVQEVLAPRAVTRLYHVPEAILGVVNLRGEILPVVDLAHLLGEAPSAVHASDSEARLVVLRAPVPATSEGHRGPPRRTPLALHVQRLSALRTVREGGLSPLPPGVPEVSARLSRGLLADPPAAMVIDTARVVECEELAQLRLG
jgi:chemotaxis signal transduction protein